MFAYRWPFPDQHVILRDFPDMPIDEKTYLDAKTAYAVLLKTEAHAIENLMLLNNQQAEQEFYHSILQHALQMAVSKNARENSASNSGWALPTRS
jgi:hypothetical protein